jgi:hypothetical protein
MHRLANANLCKWAFTKGFRYVGGLAVHTVYFDRALGEAGELGRRLAEAAVADAGGRRSYPDPERYAAYLDRPWSPLEPYLDNLTNGTMEMEGSLIAEGLATFRHPEARELLERSRVHFEAALRLYREGRPEEACDPLVKAGALWTHATWKEFLEEEVIGTPAPGAYRPIVEQEES